MKRLVVAVAVVASAGARISFAAASSAESDAVTRKDDTSADAQHPASLEQLKLSPYERETVEIVLKQRALEVEPNPEGKVLEGVDVVTLDVFEPRDPVPGFFDVFHTTTRSRIIERELLFNPGQPWTKWRVAETARRLRGIRQLSLVLIVPVRGSDSEHVRALVITKDVWSLRLNWNLRYKSGRLEYLLLQPSEENIAGTHLRLAGLYEYDVLTDSFGGTASHQRVLGTHLAFLASTSVVVERGTGNVDGTIGSLSFGQPLYSSDVNWAYGTSLVWSNRIVRWLAPAANGALVLRRYDSPLTPNNDHLPWEYKARQLNWITYVTRSFGMKNKADVSFGLETLQNRFESDGNQAGYDPRVVSNFMTTQVERSNTRIGPYARVDAYRNEYVSLLDVETLGLQEDFPIGYAAVLKTYAASKSAQSSRDLVGVAAGASYTWPLDNGLTSIWAIHNLELTPSAQQNDASIQGGVRVVTPFVGPLRLVYDGGAFARYHDYLHVRYSLGGDTRLRGYPSQFFIGSNFVTSNLELRTRPLRLWTVLMGLGAFYDVGDAFDKWDAIRPKHSVGLGIRALFPQLQRIVGRLECAFPLDRPDMPGQHWNNVDVMLTIDGQAFLYPSLVTRGSPLTARPQ